MGVSVASFSLSEEADILRKGHSEGFIVCHKALAQKRYCSNRG